MNVKNTTERIIENERKHVLKIVSECKEKHGKNAGDIQILTELYMFAFTNGLKKGMNIRQ